MKKFISLLCIAVLTYNFANEISSCEEEIFKSLKNNYLEKIVVGKSSFSSFGGGDFGGGGAGGEW